MIKLITLNLILCLSLFASEASVNSIFKKLYFDTENIVQSQCAQNIKFFIEEAYEAGINISNFKVLIIKNSGIHYSSYLKAFNVRDGKTVYSPYKKDYYVRMTGWFYHVIALYNGKVYDFSYDQEPKIHSLKTYVENMFLLKYPVPTFAQYQIYSAKKSLNAAKEYTTQSVNPIDYISGTYSLKDIKSVKLLNLY
ncbi:MAG: hypothetical protein N4A33_00250 [Bacteriovoracaceae bacterium]|jgi:hypothetical protein|nr:hypothetical protein [Bacteriovoracaceae bacterium]